MRTAFKLVILFVLISACESGKHEAGLEKLSVRLDSVFQTVPDFSGVALAAENGKPAYHKAFGYTRFQTREPLDTTAIFEIASLSKQFTSMVIMMLKEEGELAYDELLEKHIPGLPYPGITIRHLLNHTSGLPDYQAIMDQYWDKSKIADNNDNIAYLKKYHPEKRFNPGTQYEYSNTGYMLLASVAEKVSGRDFIDFCREKIFLPLGMESTDIRTHQDKLKLSSPMAWGHLYVQEKSRYVQADSFPAFNYSIWLGNRKGPGRVSSTTTDLLKWDQALYTERLVKQETLLEAFDPATLTNGSLSNYGFGWMLGQSPIGKVVRHSGSNPGYDTHIIRYVDANKTLILLCNNAHPKYEEVLSALQKMTER